VTDPQRDRLLAVLAALFAASYVAAARGIEDSLLSDAVGAGGVPQGVGIAMLMAAVALFAKSWRCERGAAAASVQAEGDGAAGPLGRREVALRTGGLVALLLGYALVLPWLGYPLSVSLLVAAVGRLAGAPPKAPLWLFAAASGPLLWLLFDRALQVRMPAGQLWGG
jgi:hypothetical protein